MSHLHSNDLSLICDMWVNKINYLLTYRMISTLANYRENERTEQPHTVKLLFLGGGGGDLGEQSGCETVTQTELDSNVAFITKVTPFVQSEQPKKLKLIPLIEKLKLKH